MAKTPLTSKKGVSKNTYHITKTKILHFLSHQKPTNKQKIYNLISFNSIPDSINNIPKSHPPYHNENEEHLFKDLPTQKTGVEIPIIIPLDDTRDKSENPKISTGLLQAQEILGKCDEKIKFKLLP